MRRRPTEACHRCREPDTRRCPTRSMMAWVRTPGPHRNHHPLPSVCRERRYCDQRGWSLWLGWRKTRTEVRRSQSIARPLAGMGRSLMSSQSAYPRHFPSIHRRPASREHERARRRITVRQAGDIHAGCSTFARTSHCECRLQHQEWIRSISGRTGRLYRVRETRQEGAYRPTCRCSHARVSGLQAGSAQSTSPFPSLSIPSVQISGGGLAASGFGVGTGTPHTKTAPQPPRRRREIPKEGACARSCHGPAERIAPHVVQVSW